MTYKFYGWETANVSLNHPDYPMVKNPRDLYDVFDDTWCIETCAPRLRVDWSETNKTCGQCSITSILVQELYGGQIYGIALPDGGYHCYNVIDGYIFDLTSEQFGEQKLEYKKENEQSGEIHLADADKKNRYELLKSRFNEAYGKR